MYIFYPGQSYKLGTADSNWFVGKVWCSALNVNISCSVHNLSISLYGKSRTFPEIADHGKMAYNVHVCEDIALKSWIFDRVQWIKRWWVELRAPVMYRVMETLRISTNQVRRISVISASLSGGFSVFVSQLSSVHQPLNQDSPCFHVLWIFK